MRMLFNAVNSTETFLIIPIYYIQKNGIKTIRRVGPLMILHNYYDPFFIYKGVAAVATDSQRFSQHVHYHNTLYDAIP
jgi:hypothetical protein